MPYLLLLLLAANPAPAADTLVVCPAAFRQALAPWVALRTDEEHRIEIISTPLSAPELRREIRTRAARGGLASVVLVGDATPAFAQAPAQNTVPTWRVDAKVIPRYGGETHIASDNPYADLDDDALPDLAVGRLTAHNPAELSAIVQKILAYERNTDFGLWRRQINLLAGVGGFGALIDGAIETAARRVLTTGMPPEYALRVTYGNWRSPYCPDPRRFRQTVIDSLGGGSLCWVYLGHAAPGRLADLEVGSTAYRSLDCANLAQVRAGRGAPIACLLACYTGAFDAAEDCLGEAMLTAPTGPVAVVCGSRVTMPYAMTVLGTELLAELFERHNDTLGQALLSAKRQMAKPEARTPTRQGLDALAALINPGPLDEELVEHLHLFNLLGDPLLRLRLPEPVVLHCSANVQAGARLPIELEMPFAGRATIELVPRRDLLSFRPPDRNTPTLPVPRADELAEFDATYRRANDPCLARVELDVEPGTVATSLTVPVAAQGPCHVRVFVAGAEAHAAGSAEVEISAAPKRSE